MPAFVLIVAGLFSSAQNASISFYEKAKTIRDYTNHDYNKNENNNTNIVMPFFTEDFAAGIPAGWTNTDNAGSGVVWVVTTTGAYNTGAVVDEQLNPSGTSAANGYLKIDSDSAGPGSAQNASITTVAINCSGHSLVHLAFNEYFAQFGASTGVVSVSNNNLNWTTVHNAEAGLTQDSGTANPNVVDLDISTIAANQATVYIRYTYTGNYDYWWFVDDIQLYEPSAVDLQAYSIKDPGNQYTKIAFPEIAQLMLEADVKNVGLNATSGGSVSFEVINAVTLASVFQETINLSPMPVGTFQTVNPVSGFTPPYTGFFKSKITVNIAGDGNASNNVITSNPVEITDSTMARDDGTFAEILGIGAGPTEDGIAGHSFNLTNGFGWVRSITFFLKDTLTFSPAGTPLYFTMRPQLNDSTPPDPVAIATTDTLWVTNGMVPAGGAWYTLSFPGGVFYSPGLYFIGFHEASDMIPMGYANTIFTPNASWVHWNSIPSPPAINGWARAYDFGFSPSYMIRLNMVIAMGLNEQSQSNAISIYPNPASNYFTLAVNKPVTEIKVQIFDAHGRVVKTQTLNAQLMQHITTHNLKAGIYTVKITTDIGICYRKLIIAQP